MRSSVSQARTRRRWLPLAGSCTWCTWVRVPTTFIIPGPRTGRHGLRTTRFRTSQASCPRRSLYGMAIFTWCIWGPHRTTSGTHNPTIYGIGLPTRGSGTSKTRTALASFNGELHMVHIGGSSNDIWHSWTSDGTNWTQQKILGQKSKTAPALASFGGELHMVHLGDGSNNLWHTWTNDGRNWTTNVRIPDQKSRATPALCEFNSQLHLAHIGDSSTTIWHSFFDINGWRPNNRRDNNQSRRGPALAAFTSGSAPGGVQQLHSMHLGKSSPRLWHTVRDTNLVTMEGPAGVTVGGTPGVLTQGDIDAVNSIYP